MKKTLLSSLLEEYAKMSPIQVKEFVNRAEVNPFNKTSGNLASRVRNNPHLNKVSRTNVGQYSGVFGSRYDDMVRNLDNDIDGDFDEWDELEQIYTTDPNYKRNEFNDELDILDIDMDAGDEFMAALRASNIDNDEFDDFEDDDDGEHVKVFAEYEPDEDDGDEDDDEFPDDDFDRLLNSGQDDAGAGMEDEPQPDDEEPDDEEESESKYDGIVRAVKGAYLVSKKQQPDETYTEVWMYNVGKKFDDEANIRKSILSYTDIDPARNFSEDGSQEAIIKTVGNVQFITVTGLPD